jgi:ornithine decarboxylase
VIDHEIIRKNYFNFKERLPRVQIYYAVKANPAPEIVRTLYALGSSFDVASLPEFNLVFDNIKHLPPRDLQNFIWDNVIYANPIKKIDSLHVLNLYKPLLTYDSFEEVEKVKTHCPDAGLLLRIKVPNKGAMVDLSCKFGVEPEDAVELIGKTIDAGIVVEGISFHVGSQCNNPDNFLCALKLCKEIFDGVKAKGYDIGEKTRGTNKKLVDIGGGFPIKYSGDEQSFAGLARILNKEFERSFPEDEFDLLAEPGRFISGNAGTAIASIILARHSRKPLPSYHIDDGVYHTYSAMIYDHVTPTLKAFKTGEEKEYVIFGPTCDGLDTVSENKYISNAPKVYLPRLENEDFIYAENMGAYSSASSSYFNGMPPAKVIHVNNLCSANHQQIHPPSLPASSPLVPENIILR